jgi:hypothetical protein
MDCALSSWRASIKLRSEARRIGRRQLLHRKLINYRVGKSVCGSLSLITSSGNTNNHRMLLKYKMTESYSEMVDGRNSPLSPVVIENRKAYGKAILRNIKRERARRQEEEQKEADEMGKEARKNS